MKPSPVRDIDLASLAKRSPLVGELLPEDDLSAIANDYITLRELAEQKQRTKFQSNYYHACLAVLSDFGTQLVRRNFALLLVWVGNLWADEYDSYVAFAKDRAELGRSQARKAYLSALMTLYFDGAGQRDGKPRGAHEEKLMVLLPDHWLPAWERVISSMEESVALTSDHVVAQLHQYCQEFPSALRSRKDQGKYDPPIRKGKKTKLGPRYRLQQTPAGQKLEYALAQLPIGALLTKLATIHKSGTAEFLVGALKHHKSKSSTIPPASTWIALLKKLDPELAVSADQAAAEGLLHFFESVTDERHRHLENRRNEYLRRCARASTTAQPPAQP